MNHASIKEDLGTLIKLMHIARNLLVNAEPEVPQDICAAVHFDQMVYQTIILCVNVTSKGYDGEILDDAQRMKLADVTELYKKLLVTALQQAHNWTAKHDRNKMSFWFDVLFDDDGALGGPDDMYADCSGFRLEASKQQVQHWLDRNSRMCDTARKLLREYTENHSDKPPGILAPIRPLARNWLSDGNSDDTESNANEEKINPIWNPDEEDKFEQDRAYGRVSREIDTWWLRVRDPNYDEWVVGMPAVEYAQNRLEQCKNNLIHTYSHSYGDDHSHSPDEVEEILSEHEHCPDCHQPHDDNEFQSDTEQDGTNKEAQKNTAENTNVDDSGDAPHQHHHTHSHEHDHAHEHDHDHQHNHDHDHHYHHCHHHHDHDHDYPHDYVDDMLDDDDVDDDDSYGEGSLTGLLTEIPNILDPKQIEALHMIVKSCILDNAGSGLTKAGENLQKTRCRMLLALDCGKSLLRELLVFIAVWDKDEQSLIFQVTTQIVEALHHSALVPYAWNTLRIPKDIISPAQTVLLRLVNHMLRARSNANTNANAEAKDNSRDVKLVHFFFSFFRSRIVPECAALMHLQSEIRQDKCDAAEFPVDSWDMERAKEGLYQYLDFLTTAAEMPDMRAKLIEWEAAYDLVTILTALEAGVPKKPLVALPKRSPTDAAADGPVTESPYGTEGTAASPPPPPIQEPAYQFPWSGIKGQIFTIIATLLQPPQGQSSPGNPEVQMQMVKYNGIVPLLNCCAYDDHNPFAKERVTICLKWLLDGCEAANNFFRELVSMAPQPNLKPPAGGEAVQTLRLDGIEGEVKVKVRSNKPAPLVTEEATSELLEKATGLNLGLSNAKSSVNAEEDFMA
ncbi:Putative Copper transport protein 86 [[Torrubiella] hemipterigena]|nr:Putative Copper transport protein 86 [[Torrubiella] hemipterigena]